LLFFLFYLPVYGVVVILMGERSLIVFVCTLVVVQLLQVADQLPWWDDVVFLPCLQWTSTSSGCALLGYFLDVDSRVLTVPSKH
jgi:hypothetical protein